MLHRTHRPEAINVRIPGPVMQRSQNAGLVDHAEITTGLLRLRNLAGCKVSRLMAVQQRGGSRFVCAERGTASHHPVGTRLLQLLRFLPIALKKKIIIN